MLITADQVGERYGVLPTDVLRRPQWEIRYNAQIASAGAAWEQKHSQSSGSAGTATDAEREQLVSDQDDRAKRREQQDGSAPLEDQLAGLDDMNGGL